ncbi:MAG: hypothetical protein Q8R24_07945 [Legionellaceae bacterium]|nr:hypothetical protein [Legionellaceae bacterium]
MMILGPYFIQFQRLQESNFIWSEPQWCRLHLEQDGKTIKLIEIASIATIPLIWKPLTEQPLKMRVYDPSNEISNTWCFGIKKVEEEIEKSVLYRFRFANSSSGVISLPGENYNPVTSSLIKNEAWDIASQQDPEKPILAKKVNLMRIRGTEFGIDEQDYIAMNTDEMKEEQKELRHLYHRYVTSIAQTASAQINDPEHAQWLNERKNLKKEYFDASIDSKNSSTTELEHRTMLNLYQRGAIKNIGFERDLQDLKNNSPSKEAYCLSLLAILDNIDVIKLLQDLGLTINQITEQQANINALRGYTFPSYINKLGFGKESYRFYTHDTRSVESQPKAIDVYTFMMDTLFSEFIAYQQEVTNHDIRSFDQKQIRSFPEHLKAKRIGEILPLEEVINDFEPETQQILKVLSDVHALFDMEIGEQLKLETIIQGLIHLPIIQTSGKTNQEIEKEVRFRDKIQNIQSELDIFSYGGNAVVNHERLSLLLEAINLRTKHVKQIISIVGSSSTLSEIQLDEIVNYMVTEYALSEEVFYSLDIQQITAVMMRLAETKNLGHISAKSLIKILPMLSVNDVNRFIQDQDALISVISAFKHKNITLDHASPLYAIIRDRMSVIINASETPKTHNVLINFLKKSGLSYVSLIAMAADTNQQSPLITTPGEVLSIISYLKGSNRHYINDKLITFEDIELQLLSPVMHSLFKTVDDVASVTRIGIERKSIGDDRYHEIITNNMLLSVQLKDAKDFERMHYLLNEKRWRSYYTELSNQKIIPLILTPVDFQRVAHITSHDKMDSIIIDISKEHLVNLLKQDISRDTGVLSSGIPIIARLLSILSAEEWRSIIDDPEKLEQVLDASNENQQKQLKQIFMEDKALSSTIPLSSDIETQRKKMYLFKEAMFTHSNSSLTESQIEDINQSLQRLKNQRKVEPSLVQYIDPLIDALRELKILALNTDALTAMQQVEEKYINEDIFQEELPDCIADFIGEIYELKSSIEAQMTRNTKK